MTAAADAVGELVIKGTAFITDGTIAGGVVLVGGPRSQSSGEVEDVLVGDIEDVLAGGHEQDEIVERVSPGSNEVWTCVKVDVLGESWGSHIGQSTKSALFLLYLESTSMA